MSPPLEVTVVDPNRRLAWTPEGRPLNYEAVGPKTTFEGKLLEQMGAKEQDRIVLLRIPWTHNDSPNIVVQYPSGGRREAGTVLLSASPRKCWVVPIKVPRSATETEGLFEFGIADGRWRTTGTRWPHQGRAKGEAFNVRLKRATSSITGEGSGANHWTLTSTLSRAPRHTAWRLLPYGQQGQPFRSVGYLQVPNQNAWTYHFEAENAKSETTRIDLQRRRFVWTKFVNLRLDPNTK